MSANYPTFSTSNLADPFLAACRTFESGTPSGTYDAENNTTDANSTAFGAYGATAAGSLTQEKAITGVTANVTVAANWVAKSGYGSSLTDFLRGPNAQSYQDKLIVNYLNDYLVGHTNNTESGQIGSSITSTAATHPYDGGHGTIISPTGLLLAEYRSPDWAGWYASNGTKGHAPTNAVDIYDMMARFQAGAMLDGYPLGYDPATYYTNPTTLTNKADTIAAAVGEYENHLTGSVLGVSGNTLSGNITPAHPDQRFHLTLDAGFSYDFSGTSNFINSSSVAKSGWVTVENSTGGGAGADFAISATSNSTPFTATTAGNYYLDVHASSSDCTGSFTLTAAAPDDYANNATTIGLLAIGGSASGKLATPGDHDQFKISLVAGTHYEVDLTSSFANSQGVAQVGFLALYQLVNGVEESVSTGMTISSSGKTPWTFSTPTAGTGDYYIDIDSNNGTGSYAFSAKTTTASAVTSVTSDTATSDATTTRQVQSLPKANAAHADFTQMQQALLSHTGQNGLLAFQVATQLSHGGFSAANDDSATLHHLESELPGLLHGTTFEESIAHLSLAHLAA